MDTDQFPYTAVSKELLDALDSIFPQRSPARGESHDDLMFRGGERSVVDFLHAQYERHFEVTDSPSE